MHVIKYFASKRAEKKQRKQLLKKQIEEKENYEQRVNALLRTVDNLTNDELVYLTVFIDNGVDFLDMPVNDGIVNVLEKRGMIERTSNISKSMYNFTFKINPYVVDYLRKNPKLQRRKKEDRYW
jgi:hypothetical protein